MVEQPCEGEMNSCHKRKVRAVLACLLPCASLKLDTGLNEGSSPGGHLCQAPP